MLKLYFLVLEDTIIDDLSWDAARAYAKQIGLEMGYPPSQLLMRMNPSREIAMEYSVVSGKKRRVIATIIESRIEGEL